jgi:hypothetical protein
LRFLSVSLLLFPCRFARDKNKSIEKLRLLVEAMEEKQLWKDQALLAAVDELVSDFLLYLSGLVFFRVLFRFI